jgi:hypothetical protein
MASSVARAHRSLGCRRTLRRGDERAPSLLRFAPTMIALLVVVVSSSDLADPDLWRSLKFGADMIAHGGVLRVDPYSYAIRSLPWVSHEWLSEVIFAWTFARFGVIGLKLLWLASSAIAVSFLAAAVAKTRASLNIQLGVMILLAIGLTPEMQFRPQIFTYAMLSHHRLTARARQLSTARAALDSHSDVRAMGQPARRIRGRSRGAWRICDVYRDR